MNELTLLLARFQDFAVASQSVSQLYSQITTGWFNKLEIIEAFGYGQRVVIKANKRDSNF